MTVEFNLPDIGEGLHEAEIVRWMVREGQRIERNQPFVEILTDKSNVEMPAPAAGLVTRLVPAEGDMVQVGDLLIVIDDGSGPAASDPLPPSAEEARGVAPVSPAPTPSPPTEGGPPIRRPKASPSTRRLAAELGVDLASVSGTGPGGRILATDVTAAGEGPAPAAAAPPTGATHPLPSPRPAPAQGGPGLGWMATGTHPLRGIRRATARAMDRSWSTIPHISASQEIDASALLEARRALRDRQDPDGPPITPLALVMMAVARALRRYPMMNAALDLETETITVPERVNIGVAVATERGLMVPVVADADRLGLLEVAGEIRRLSVAAREGAVRPEELAGGTHTVTNYGSAGGHLAAPIIRPGETAITGLGAIADRPIVIDGEVVARPTMPVVVCSDHRLIDGDVMAAFHLDICRTLSSPIELLL